MKQSGAKVATGGVLCASFVATYFRLFVTTPEVAGVDFGFDVFKFFVVAVAYNNVALCLEGVQVIDDGSTNKHVIGDGWLVENHRRASFA